MGKKADKTIYLNVPDVGMLYIKMHQTGNMSCELPADEKKRGIAMTALIGQYSFYRFKYSETPEGKHLLFIKPEKMCD